MNDWYFSVRFRILGDFEGTLRRDDNSASREGGTK